MSKVGLHSLLGPRTGLGDFYKKIADAGQSLAVIKCVDDFGPANEAKSYNSKTLTVGRLNSIRDADGNIVDLQGLNSLVESGVSPADGATWYYNLVKAKWIANRAWIDVWETCNEWSAHWDWQASFYRAMMDLMERDGFKLAMFACSTGNPPLVSDDGGVAQNAILRACQRAKQGGHYLSLHQYGGVGNKSATSLLDKIRKLVFGAEPNPPTLQGTEPYHALRHRFLYDEVLKPNNAVVPLIISEAGQNGGAEFIGTDILIQDYTWYDSELFKDDYVVGAAAWSVGGLNEWAGANISPALPALADYIIAHPTPEPPPPPDDGRVPYPYARTVHLVPQDTNDAEYDEVVYVAKPLKQSIVFSANDAFITHEDLTKRTVYVWNVDRQNGKDELETWVVRHYPPLPEIIYKEFAQAPNPPPIEPTELGLHLFSGADTDSGFSQDIDMTVRAKAKTVKVTTNCPPDRFDRLVQSGVPAIKIMLRLHMAFSSYESPETWYHRFGESTGNNMNYPLSWFRAKGGLLVEIGNEPNNPFAPQDGYGIMWRSAAEWRIWWDAFVTLCRTDYPGLKFGLPGLAPNPNVPEWIEAYKSLTSKVSWVGVHAYAVQDGTTLSSASGGWLHPESGLYWQRFSVLGLPARLTEIGNVSDLVAFDTKGAQYVAYQKILDSFVGFKPKATYWYITRTQNADEITNRQYMDGTRIPDILGAR